MLWSELAPKHLQRSPRPRRPPLAPAGLARQRSLESRAALEGLGQCSEARVARGGNTSTTALELGSVLGRVVYS